VNFINSEMAGDLEVVVAAPLVTGRYRTWEPGDGVPIRTTVGSPKFWKGGPLIDLRDVAPYGVFGQVADADAAREAYRQRIEQRAPRIVATLAALAHQHENQALVLLCFEDVHAGQVCHRRWFAEWFEERFGIEVPELGARPPENEGGGEQLGLW
jgi:hypothetical protein